MMENQPHVLKRQLQKRLKTYQNWKKSIDATPVQHRQTGSFIQVHKLLGHSHQINLKPEAEGQIRRKIELVG
jgi:hypothetical protein